MFLTNGATLVVLLRLAMVPVTEDVIGTRHSDFAGCALSPGILLYLYKPRLTYTNVSHNYSNLSSDPGSRLDRHCPPQVSQGHRRIEHSLS